MGLDVRLPTISNLDRKPACTAVRVMGTRPHGRNARPYVVIFVPISLHDSASLLVALPLASWSCCTKKLKEYD